jgi:hypothetical protein
MTLPNFFIVGAAKSGTTSLYQYLKQHPQIFMSEVKEPCYFIEWEGGIQNREAYEKLFSKGLKDQAIGEASTPYLFDHEVPQKIRSLIPHARILIILRNPAEMAFSLWKMNRNVERADERLSFADALNEELHRMSDPEFRIKCKSWWHGNFYYFHRGLYYSQVKRYLELFGENQIRVFLFEDLRNDPLKVCQEVFRFLNVDPEFVPEIKIHNANLFVHSKKLYYYLTHWGTRQTTSSEIIKGFGARLKEFLMRFNFKKPPKLDQKLAKQLLESYRSDIEKLGKLIQRDLSFWK